MTLVIEEILAGKAVDVALRGVRGGWRAFARQPDSLGRLLVLLHADFGRASELGRDVFYSWRADDRLCSAFEQVLTGRRGLSPTGVDSLRDLIEPRLVRTPRAARRGLAEQLARMAFAAAPMVVEGGDEATRLLLGHIDAVGDRLPERDDAWRSRRRASGYRATVAELAPETLRDRERELAELGAFAVGAEGYRWLVGGPWTGKTALVAKFVLSCAPEVDVVAYFLSRPRADADSRRFLQVVNAQLATLLGEERSGLDDADAFRELWARAAAEAERRERHLLLVVDGLDEDVGPALGRPSVAQMLPARAGGRCHVLVSSRRYPLLPSDVAADHALRDVSQNELEQSLHAARLEQRARQDLDALLGRRDKDDLVTDLLGLIAAAKGPLAVHDLSELARLADPRVRQPRVMRVVEQEIGRVLEPTGPIDAPRFVFSHVTLLARAETELAADLAGYHERLHEWARSHEDAGWEIERTPSYLVDSYPALLQGTDSERLESLYDSCAYLECAIRSIGVHRVAGDLHVAAAAVRSESLRSLSRVVDREGHNLREPLPAIDLAYIGRQLLLQAMRSDTPGVVEHARRRLTDLPRPQLIPCWTRAPSTAPLLRIIESHGWLRATNADGSIAIGIDSDHLVRIWDVGLGSVVHQYEELTCSWPVVVSADASRAVGVIKRHALHVWDVSDGATLHVLEAHADALTDVAISADGTRAISAAHDRSLRVWDLADGEVVHTLRCHEVQWFVAINADGTRAVSSGEDGPLTMWDLEDGRVLHRVNGPSRFLLEVAISGRGTRALSSHDDGLHVWNVSTGELMHVLDTVAYPIAISADGERAVTGNENSVTVWDVTRGERLHVLHGHTSGIVDLVMAADGTRAISRGDDRTMRVWDLRHGGATRVEGCHPGSVRSLAVSAEAGWGISGSEAGRSDESAPPISTDRMLFVWDVTSGATVHALQGHADTVEQVAISRDGTRALSTSHDGSLRIWDLCSGRNAGVLELGLDRMWEIALSADAMRAVGADSDGLLHVWDVPTGRVVHRLTGHSPYVELAMSADGERMLVWGNERPPCVWDLSSGELIRASLDGTERMTPLALSADGTVAIGACPDHSLRVWDVDSGTTLQTLHGHTSSVWHVTIGLDGAVAASSDRDRTVRVWSLVDGTCAAAMKLAIHVDCLAFAAADQSLRLLVGDGVGDVTSFAFTLP